MEKEILFYLIFGRWKACVKWHCVVFCSIFWRNLFRFFPLFIAHFALEFLFQMSCTILTFFSWFFIPLALSVSRRDRLQQFKQKTVKYFSTEKVFLRSTKATAINFGIWETASSSHGTISKLSTSKNSVWMLKEIWTIWLMLLPVEVISLCSQVNEWFCAFVFLWIAFVHSFYHSADSGKLYGYGLFDASKIRKQKKLLAPKQISENQVVRVVKCGSSFTVFVNGMTRHFWHFSFSFAFSFQFHLISRQFFPFFPLRFSFRSKWNFSNRTIQRHRL